MPIGTGYLDGGLAITRLRGPEAWAEAGWHPRANIALFGRGSFSPVDAGAMVGVRWIF